MCARRPPFEESSCADASDGNSSDYSRCLCFVVLRTVSFIQIRRAAHSFSRDSAASATSLCVKRADADISHVTGQLGWVILLTVCLSRFVMLRGGRGWRRFAPGSAVPQHGPATYQQFSRQRHDRLLSACPGEPQSRSI